uniref:Uncharacterized protein n=1 Tax=Caenorhabditis japonica TaxID=281687 RepID=A0A8R1E6S5_CAEJA
MREVAEFLGKAGLNKDVLQVKVLDANGNELGNMDLGGLSKDLFEKVDAMARMKQTEKAYAKKFVVEDEEEEPLE